MHAYKSMREASSQEQGLLRIPVSFLDLKTTQMCSWVWGEKAAIHEAWFEGKNTPLKIISPTKPISGLKFPVMFTEDSF